MPRTIVSAKSGEPGPHARSGPSASVTEDRALLSRMAGGESAAFRLLADRHLGAVLRLAGRMLRDAAEAEDVAQETLLRLWRSGAGLDLGPHGLRPWLLRVATNLCIDRIRAGGRFDVTDEVPEQPVAPCQLKGLAEQDLSVRVGAAIKALPDRQRVALTLFHFEGLSQVEAGAMMGLSDEAVESLLARARRSLKAALASDWQGLLGDGAGEWAGQ